MQVSYHSNKSIMEELRKALGYTKAKMAMVIGVSYPTYNRYLQGVAPPSHRAVHIEALLGDQDYLFTQIRALGMDLPTTFFLNICQQQLPPGENN